jgi:nicotinamidase-related amidase
MRHKVDTFNNDALIVTDIQNDFCPHGPLAVPKGDEIIPIINRIGRYFPHVILTQDWHPQGHHSFASSHPHKKPYDTFEASYGTQILWPDHCVQGSTGASFHAMLDLPASELVIRKGFSRELDSYSAFFENDHKTRTGLGGYLGERGLLRLFFVGLATDFCVTYSALDARKLGFEVYLIEDACRAIDLRGSLEESMKKLNDAGVRLVKSTELHM